MASSTVKDDSAGLAPALSMQRCQFIPIPSYVFAIVGLKQAQLREHSERMAPGIWVNLFQASQQASRIWS